jgi:peroxiredoxin/predicted 2-oxoglutarate/Fe(II)-dependent dioxygenase YbiX
MEVGDYLRPFDLPSTIDDHLKADDCVGDSLVLIFYLKDESEDDTKMLAGFRDLHEQFLSMGVNVAAVGLEPIESHRQFAQQLNLKLPLLSDNGLKLSREFGVLNQATVDDKPALQMMRHTFFFDRSLRVVKVYSKAPVEGHAQQVLDDARAWLDRDPPRDMVTHAPVLLIPHVLPPDLCKDLVAAWESQNEESGFMKQVEGKTVGVTDYSHKIRRDHFLTAGPVHDRVKNFVAERVVPEIFKAYNYRVTRREDFRIACYDASKGGYFRPHRDNTTGGTAHRRFAMSLLLNDDYEGGHLRFPEFGQHRYRPHAGDACIFSCSLLHEATDVTAGRRFVLLSFFYGEAEAKIREEYNKRTGGTYRA